MSGTLKRSPSQKQRKAAPEKSWSADKLGETPSKRIAANIDVDLGSFKQSKQRRLAHYFLQIPMYFIKFPLAILLGLWSALFWRTPTSEDMVTLMESTSLITLLRRDWAAERTAPSTGGMDPARVQLQSNERRCYYVRVDKCMLEHVIRKRGETYDEGVVTPIKSWSMRYTKTLSGGGISSNTNSNSNGNRETELDQDRKQQSSWTVTITSFLVNGKPVLGAESRMSFLHLYCSTSTHTKCHVLGNALVERIVSDDLLKSKLTESTWTTTWLHHGLLHGSLGPLTSVRTEGNKWMGLGTSTKRDSVLAESRNMSSLGGADHAREDRWIDLGLPLADFILGARKVLRRAMRDNGIPLDLQEGLFLSVIMHALDHVIITRMLWGVRYKIDFLAEHTTWGDHCESACWSFMWVAPTLHPFFQNKIRSSTKPFYQQLYRGLKKIDTLQIADEVTASIMY